jgi:hypothetical protein
VLPGTCSIAIMHTCRYVLHSLYNCCTTAVRTPRAHSAGRAALAGLHTPAAPYESQKPDAPAAAAAEVGHNMGLSHDMMS